MCAAGPIRKRGHVAHPHVGAAGDRLLEALLVPEFSVARELPEAIRPRKLS